MTAFCPVCLTIYLDDQEEGEECINCGNDSLLSYDKFIQGVVEVLEHLKDDNDNTSEEIERKG